MVTENISTKKKEFSSIGSLYPLIQRPSKSGLIASFISGLSRNIQFGMDALKTSVSKQVYETPRDWVFPIEHQGQTMCCLSFAVSYMLRARQRRTGSVVKPYSPRHLHFCGFGLPHDLGPAATFAFNTMKGVGVPVYSGVQENWIDKSFCSTQPPTEQLKVKTIQTFASPSMLKKDLVTNGAIVTHILVDDAFFDAYVPGTVYMVKDSSMLKAHCVCLTGFDDNQECWIGVNSFGVGWGDGGFFKVSYAGCGILEYDIYPAFSVDLQ